MRIKVLRKSVALLSKILRSSYFSSSRHAVYFIVNVMKRYCFLPLFAFQAFKGPILLEVLQSSDRDLNEIEIRIEVFIENITVLGSNRLIFLSQFPINFMPLITAR